MNIFKKKQETDSIQLGKYPVEVAKLTPAKWKQLFAALDKIPFLVLDLFLYILSNGRGIHSIAVYQSASAG